MDTINNFIQISKEEFKKELEDKSIVLIDVRTFKEQIIY
jgi:hypothetical protein